MVLFAHVGPNHESVLLRGFMRLFCLEKKQLFHFLIVKQTLLVMMLIEYNY